MDIEAIQQDPSWRLRRRAFRTGQNGVARVTRARVLSGSRPLLDGNACRCSHRQAHRLFKSRTLPVIR
jgi:hypothetical protein